jgi:hypothetical protein
MQKSTQNQILDFFFKIYNDYAFAKPKQFYFYSKFAQQNRKSLGQLQEEIEFKL